jgi:hypothetical protein
MASLCRGCYRRPWTHGATAAVAVATAVAAAAAAGGGAFHRGYPSWQSTVAAWYSEVSSYSFSSPGWSGATGHFTQLVWKDTTKVGCGYNARCPMTTYVCQYSPAGMPRRLHTPESC